MKFLKKFRVAFALIFFCLISVQFFDLYHLLPDFYYNLNPTSTQFIPSLLLLKTFGFGICGAGIAFVFFSVFALIFGRAYCSFICPFGILMDVMRRFSFSKKRKLKYAYAKGRNILRGTFLILAALAIGFGYTALLGFIDPYSLYGKIAGSLSALLGMGANELSSALYANGVYFLQPTSGSTQISLVAFAVALFILIAISIVSYARGRIFCNTLCPVGAFLGLLSRFSLFKISLDEKTCISCGICEKNCKAQCIKSKEKRLDFSRCVLCFNCAKKCPKSSIKISPRYFSRAIKTEKKFENKIEKKAENKTEISLAKPEPEFSRRDFNKKSFLSLALMLSTSKAMGNGKNRGKNSGKNCGKNLNFSQFRNPRSGREDSCLTVPAGSGSIESFLSKCTGCQACVSACDAFILKPSISEWGLKGIMQPFMDFRNGYCLHECNSCTKVCPVGAITHKDVEEKKKIKIGTAVLLRSLCVVETDETDCAACAEHCPVQAIEMTPYKPEKSLYIPRVHSRVCIGCGACEYICPVKPEKAIVIRGLAVHETAMDFKEVLSRRRARDAEYEDDAKSTTPKPAPKAAAPSDNPFPF